MIPAGVRIFVCTDPVDMRYGFDRLAAAARASVACDPQQGGALFVFANRGASGLKVLWYDRNGAASFEARRPGAGASRCAPSSLAILIAVPSEHRLDGRFQLGGMSLEVRSGTAPALARVAWQLNAVDGEHLAADQALPVAKEEHLREELGDGVGASSHEGCNGGKVRPTIARQRHERDVLTAGPLDLPAADDAARVGEQHNLEQHQRRIRRRPAGVVAVGGIKRRQVRLVVDQVRRRVLERPGEELAGQVHRQELRIGVDVLVARHSPEKSLTKNGLSVYADALR